jgi:hypothetical protein
VILNNFVVKKLAEVQAFVSLKDQILDKAGDGFMENATTVAKSLTGINADLSMIIDDTDNMQTFKTKHEATVNKLTTMMNLYVGDSWDDSVEVLEWLSFYAGSASAHSDLAKSALNELGNEAGYQTTSGLSDSFWEVLVQVKQALSESAIQRVKDINKS